MQQLLDGADEPSTSVTPDIHFVSPQPTSMQATDMSTSVTPDIHIVSPLSTSMQATDMSTSVTPDIHIVSPLPTSMQPTDSNTQIDLLFESLVDKTEKIAPTMSSSPIHNNFENDTVDYDISLMQESTLKGSEYIPGESSQDSLDTIPEISASGGEKSQNHWPGSSNVREKSFVITESHLKQLLALIPCSCCMSKDHRQDFQERVVVWALDSSVKTVELMY